MQKTVIVINGCGGVGKGTLCNIAARHFSVRNISSITPIKQLAASCGWNGEKNDRARKFLSDLKQLTIDYNDYPLSWLTEQYRDFLQGSESILFVHIREPQEIEKFVRATSGKAVTLLVRGSQAFYARREGQGYGNSSDDGVENYRYDYYYTNDRPLRITELVFTRFVRKILSETRGRA